VVTGEWQPRRWGSAGGGRRGRKRSTPPTTPTPTWYLCRKPERPVAAQVEYRPDPTPSVADLSGRPKRPRLPRSCSLHRLDVVPRPRPRASPVKLSPAVRYSLSGARRSPLVFFFFFFLSFFSFC
jgi:hypothetical protein